MTWVWRGLAVFAVFYLLTDPSGAAGLVHNAAGALLSVGHALSSFTSDLGSK